MTEVQMYAHHAVPTAVLPLQVDDDHDCPSAGDESAVNQTGIPGSQSHSDSSRRRRRYQTALETIQECEGLNFGGLSEVSFQSSFEDDDENDYSGSSTCSIRSSNCTIGSKSRIALSQDSIFSLSSRVFDISDEQLSRNSNVGLQTLYHTLVWEAEEDEDPLQGHSRAPVREGADPVASAIRLDRSHSTPCRPAAPSRSLTPSPDLFLTSSVAMLKYACWNHQYEKSLMEQHQCDSPGGDVKNRAGTFEMSSNIHSPLPRSRPPMLGAPDEPPKEAMFYNPPYGPLVDVHESTVVQRKTLESCDDGIVIQLKPSIVNITSQHIGNDLPYDGSAEPNICHYEKEDKDLISFDRVETQLPIDLTMPSPFIDIDFETPSSTESIPHTLQHSDDILKSKSLLDEPNPTEELSSSSSETNGNQRSMSTTLNELLTLMTSSVEYENKVAVSEEKSSISDYESSSDQISSERSGCTLESMVTHPDIYVHEPRSPGEYAENSEPGEYKSIISKSANLYASLERNNKGSSTQDMLADLIALVARTVSQLKTSADDDTRMEPSQHPILIDARSGPFRDSVFSDAEIILPPSRLSSSSIEGQSCESFLDLDIVYRHLRLAETKRDTSRTKLNLLMTEENEVYKLLCNETQSMDNELIHNQSFTDRNKAKTDLVLFEKNHSSKENLLTYYKDRPSLIPYIVDTSLSFSPLYMNEVQHKSIIFNNSFDITANSTIISKDSSNLSNESRHSNDVKYGVNFASDCTQDFKVGYKDLYGLTEPTTTDSDNSAEEYLHSFTTLSRYRDVMNNTISRTSVEVSMYPQLNNTKLASHSSYSKTQLLKQTNYLISSNNRKITPINSEVKVINPRLNDFKGGISKWLHEEKYLEKCSNMTNKSTNIQDEDIHKEKQQQQNNNQQQQILEQDQQHEEKQQKQTNTYQQSKLLDAQQKTNEHQQSCHYQQEKQKSQQQTNQQYKQQQQDMQNTNELPQNHQYQQQQQQKTQQKTNEHQQQGQYLQQEINKSQKQRNEHYEQQQPPQKSSQQTNQYHAQEQLKPQKQTNQHQEQEQYRKQQHQEPKQETEEHEQNNQYGQQQQQNPQKQKYEHQQQKNSKQKTIEHQQNQCQNQDQKKAQHQTNGHHEQPSTSQQQTHQHHLEERYQKQPQVTNQHFLYQQQQQQQRPQKLEHDHHQQSQQSPQHIQQSNDQQTNQYPHENYQQQQQEAHQQKRKDNIQQSQYQQQKPKEHQQTTVHHQHPQQLQQKVRNQQQRQQQQSHGTDKCAANKVRECDKECENSKNVSLDKTMTNTSSERNIVNNSESANAIKRAMALSAMYKDLAYECSLININIKREISSNLISNVRDKTSGLKLSSTNPQQSSSTHTNISADTKSKRGMAINNHTLLNTINESNQFSNKLPCTHKSNVISSELETPFPITVSNIIASSDQPEFLNVIRNSSHNAEQNKLWGVSTCPQEIHQISSNTSESEKVNTIDDSSKMKCFTSIDKHNSIEQHAVTSSNKWNVPLNSSDGLRKELTSNERMISSISTLSKKEFQSNLQEIINRNTTLLIPKKIFDDKNTYINKWQMSDGLLKQDIPTQPEIYPHKSLESTPTDGKQQKREISQTIHRDKGERKDKNVHFGKKISQKKKSPFTTQLQRFYEDRASSIESSSKRDSSCTSERRSKMSSDKWIQGSRSRRHSKIHGAKDRDSRVLTFDEIMTWVEMSKEHIGIDTIQGDRDMGHEIFIPERDGRPTIHRFNKNHKKSPFHAANLLKESKAYHNGLRPSLHKGKCKSNALEGSQNYNSLITVTSPVARTTHSKRSTTSNLKRSEKNVTKKQTSNGRVTKAKSKPEVNMNAVLKKLVVTVSKKSTNGSTGSTPVVNSKCLFGDALLRAFLLKAKSKFELEDRKEIENETDTNNTPEEDYIFPSLSPPTRLFNCKTNNAISPSNLKEELKAQPSIQFGFAPPIKTQHSHDTLNQFSKTNNHSITGFLKKYGNLSEYMKNLQLGAKHVMPCNACPTQNTETLLPTQLPTKDRPASINCDPNSRSMLNTHLQYQNMDTTYKQPSICKDIQTKSPMDSQTSMKQWNITTEGCTAQNVSRSLTVASSNEPPISTKYSPSRLSTALGNQNEDKGSILSINDTASSSRTKKGVTQNANKGIYSKVFNHPLSKAVFDLINSLTDEDSDLENDSSFYKPEKCQSKKIESPIFTEINTDTTLTPKSDTKAIKHIPKLLKSKSNNSSLTLSERVDFLKSGLINNKFPCVNKFTTGPSAVAPAFTTNKVSDEISKLEGYTHKDSDKDVVSPLSNQQRFPSSRSVVSPKRLSVALSDTAKKANSSKEMPLTGLRGSVSCERPRVRVENPKRSWLARDLRPRPVRRESDAVSVASSGSGSARTCPSFSKRRCDDEDEVPEKPFLDHLDNSITTSVNALSRDSMMEIQDLSYQPSSWSSASTDAYLNLSPPCNSLGTSASYMYSTSYNRTEEEMKLMTALHSEQNTKNTGKNKLKNTKNSKKTKDTSLKSNKIACKSVELGGMVFIGMDECSSVIDEATGTQCPSPVDNTSYGALFGEEEGIKILAKKAHTEESIGSTKNKRRRDLRETTRGKARAESDNTVNRIKCLPPLPKKIQCDEKHSVPKIAIPDDTAAPKEKPQAVTLEIKKTQNWRSSKTITSARLEIMESNSLSGMSTNILNQIKSSGKKSVSASNTARQIGNKRAQKRPFLNTHKRINYNRGASGKNGTRVENVLFAMLESIIENGKNSEGGKSAPCVLASSDKKLEYGSKQEHESQVVENCKKGNENDISISRPMNNNSTERFDEQSSRSNMAEKSVNVSPDANAIDLNVDNSDQTHDTQTSGEHIVNMTAQSQRALGNVHAVKTNYSNDSKALTENNSVTLNATGELGNPSVNTKSYYDNQSEDYFLIPTTDARCIIKKLIDVPNNNRTCMWLDENFGLSPSKITLDNIGLGKRDSISEIGSYTLSECVLLCKSVQSISSIELEEWGSTSLTGCKSTENIYLDEEEKSEINKLMTNDENDYCKPLHINSKERIQDLNSINEIKSCSSGELHAKFITCPSTIITCLKTDSSSKSFVIKLGPSVSDNNKSSSEKKDGENMPYDAFLEEVINDDEEEEIDEEFQKRCVRYTVDKLAAEAEEFVVKEVNLSDGAINMLEDKVVVSDSKIDLLSDNNNKVVLDLRTPQNNEVECIKRVVNTSVDDILKLIEVKSSISGTQISLALPHPQHCSCHSNKVTFKINSTTNVVTLCVETLGSKSSNLAITDGSQEEETIGPSDTTICRDTLSRVGTLQAFSSTVMYNVDDVYISTEQGSCIETCDCSISSQNNKMVECTCDLTGGYENSFSSRSLVDEDTSTHANSDASCEDDEIIIHDLASQTTLRGVLAALSHKDPMDILEDTSNDTIEGEIINNGSKPHTMQSMLHAFSGLAPPYISSEDIYHTDIYTTVHLDDVTESMMDVTTDNASLSMDGVTISMMWEAPLTFTPFSEAIVYNLNTCQNVIEEWEQINIIESLEKVIEKELLTDTSVEQVPNLLTRGVLAHTNNERTSFQYGEQTPILQYDLSRQLPGERVHNSALEEDEVQRFLSREQFMEQIEEEGDPDDTSDELLRFRPGARGEQVLVGAGDGARTSRSLQPDEHHDLWPQLALEDIVHAGSSYNPTDCPGTSSLSVIVTPSVADNDAITAITSTSTLPETLPSFLDFIRGNSSTDSNSTTSGQDSDNEFISNMIAYTQLLSNYTRNFNRQARALNQATTTVSSDSVRKVRRTPSSRSQMITMLCTFLFILVVSTLHLPFLLLEML